MIHWIRSADELRDLLRDPPSHYALDTEFVREKTFWPILALVQLALPSRDSSSEAEIYLIDPLLAGVNAVLRDLFLEPSCTGVVHSPSEDWVALRENIGALPQKVFDTQHAAAMLGIGYGMSYLRLVEAITGVQLEKGETRSNWLQRPLTDSQKKYAADDVLHLLQVYVELRSQLIEHERLAWMEEDMARVLASASVDTIEPYPHLGVRGAGNFGMNQQKVLHRLLRWREAQARDSNLPKTWILGNELAFAIARDQIGTSTALNTCMNKIPKSPFKFAKKILSVATTPLPDEDSLPDARDLERRDKERVRALQKIVQDLTVSLGMSDGILASRRRIEQWVDDGQWTGSFAGWRREILEPLFSAAEPEPEPESDPE